MMSLIYIAAHEHLSFYRSDFIKEQVWAIFDIKIHKSRLPFPPDIHHYITTHIQPIFSSFLTHIAKSSPLARANFIIHQTKRIIFIIAMALKLLIILITLIAIARTVPTACNSTSPYTLPATGKCYLQCPWTAPNLYYNDPATLTCVTACTSPYFAFAGNQTCVSTCPTSPNLTYYDYSTRKCVSVCPVNTYAASNQSCLASCPAGTWGNQGQNICVATCPVGTLYANVTVPLCVTICPANYYASPIDRVCYIGGSCLTTPVRYYADDTTGKCVTSCPSGYFADNTNGRCVIYCSSSTQFADPVSKTCVQTCSSGYFRSTVSKSCVKSCTVGYFSDASTGNCTQFCTNNTYGDSLTGLCAKVCTMPNYAEPNSKLCVAICPSGLFSNNFTQSCVVAASCYSNTIGDPTTNQCINNTNCPKVPYMFADLVNKICTTRCSTWGNKVTRLCVAECPWDANNYVTYQNPDTNQCVTKCPTFPVLYADNSTKSCVSTCPQAPTVTFSTYADPTTQSCVRVCPTGYSADLNKLTCVATCTTYPVLQFFEPVTGSCVTSCPTGTFSDVSKGQCVANCSTSPQYFAYSGNNTCLFVCPAGFFGDTSTGTCVEQCPQTTLQFADSSVNLCVNTCPLFPDTYGEIGADGSRRCVSNCSHSNFADPISRLCVSSCVINYGYYGLSNMSTCVLECPDGTFADNATAQCVVKCSNFPTKFYGNPDTKMCHPRCPSYLYGNPNSNLCVAPTGCPSGFFADDVSQLCVALCPSNASTFGEPTSRKCVQVCPEGTFADRTSRICTSSCNLAWKLYRDNSTKSCVPACPSNPNTYADPLTMNCTQYCSGGYFAYDLTRTCVQMCPSTPAMYGNYQTMRCVSSCPRETYIFVDNSNRGCVTTCPQRVFTALYVVDLYADNSTWSCVSVCPSSKALYSFKHPDIATVRTCVLTCPMVNSTYYFAENTTQSCVTTCPSSTRLTYGDIFTSKCVLGCSRNQFRDNTTSRCVYACSPGYFADNTTWNCVSECPKGLFAEATNQTCSKHCPSGTYADNETRYCRSLCDTELFLYSDNTTWECVTQCPSVPDFYADLGTKLCSIFCTGGLFADEWTRSCLPAVNCSNQTIGDPLYFRCVTVCPIQTPSFLDSSINQCTRVCPIGQYSDNSTMNCVAKCPSSPDYYAYNVSLANGTVVEGLCVLLCPILPTPYYRHEPTRECLLQCPGTDYFKDSTTLRCVKKCPPFYYAESTGQVCVQNCSGTSKFGFKGQCLPTCPNNTNADPTTSLCVDTCPFGYFSQSNVCVPGCTNGYADPFLKMCVDLCSPDYFSYLPTRECRQGCQPQFKYFPDQACTLSCPTTGNLSTNLYMDTNTYSCVNKCLPTWYADNSTRYCTQSCSGALLADNSTGLCVVKCPSVPDLFGFNNVCSFPCPIQTPMLFAQNDTRTCMPTCPNNSFADTYTRRCVAACTKTQYGFTDGVTPVCLDICPPPTYGNKQTKTCVPNCPNGTFADNGTRLCLPYCPTGSFADTHINVCVEFCNNSIPEFADPSTHRCVTKCPEIPSLYGDFLNATNIPVCVPACLYNGNFTLNTTRLCVTACPDPFFADPITGDCAIYCKPDSGLFADNSTRRCTSCPNITYPNGSFFYHTYADPSTMKCVAKCPSSPSLYGDNFTNTCVDRCPVASYGDNDTRFCLQYCFNNIVVANRTKFTFADNSTNFCVYTCPQNSWADNFTVTCTNNCTLGTFADDSTWRCVAMCPANPISYAYSPTRRCIYACPGGFFSSDVGRACMNGTCPTIPYFYYRDYQNNQCVLKCVYPYFGETTSQSCATNCSYGFYQNLGSMTCTKCPTQCLTCINSGNCTTCKPGLYLHIGQCVTNCPTFPIYYFKYDPSFACITACPPPYFGFQGTGKCENSCPVGYFSNITTKQCEICPTGCSGCYGTTCSSCSTGYVFVAKYSTCNKICSISLPYFLNGKCVSSCSPGTFMLDDLVTCQRCNSICAECSKLASNCTKCAGAFWYNYNCVGSCPSSYYVDGNNACQQCSSNPSACSKPALTYTVTTKTVNYQLYVIVTFSRAVALTASQFAKIAQIQTNRGPIRASEYTLSQISSTVFQCAMHNSASLNELSLSISFTPGSIFDSTGSSGLTQATSSVSVPAVTSISTQTQTQAKQLSGQVNALSWVLIVVIILMMFKSNYPMIILLDVLQFIHMHIYVIAIPLPYLYMQVVSVMKNLNFAFLPTLYTNPKPNTSDPYYNFQQDTTFLGNCQPFIFLLAIFGGAYLITWLLTQRKINRFKGFRHKMKEIFKVRMRFSFIHEIFYYTVFYVFFFAVYQFTGINNYIDNSNGNFAAAVIIALLYMIWLIAITYHAARYKQKFQKIPQKFKFLNLETSNFPMETPLRALFKIMVGCALIAPTVSIQLVMLVVLNLTMLFFIICFKPSKNKVTNYVNAFVHISMIIYEIVLFIYSNSAMTPSYQNTISYGLFALIGVTVLVIIGWIIYRLVLHIRQECFGIKPEEEMSSEASVKQKKQVYEVVKQSSQRVSIKDKDFKFSDKEMHHLQKDMNISQLNINDEEDRESENSININEAIQQFAYHYVPKKSEGLIKHEQAILGIKEQKKDLKPIVIEIDENELIQEESDIRISESRASDRARGKRIKSSLKEKRGHLRIEGDDRTSQVQEMQMQQSKPVQAQETKRLPGKDKKQNKPLNLVVWDDPDISEEFDS